MLTTTGRELRFVQIVRSKSQPAPYTVRGFEGGLITCECDGYKHRSKCRHQALGLAQEQREQEAWEAFQRHEPTLDDPEFDSARELLVEAGPEPFDAPGVNWDGAQPEPFHAGECVVYTSPRDGRRVQGIIQYVNGDQACIRYSATGPRNYRQELFSIAGITPAESRAA
jgi:hypothetical protein